MLKTSAKQHAKLKMDLRDDFTKSKNNYLLKTHQGTLHFMENYTKLVVQKQTLHKDHCFFFMVLEKAMAKRAMIRNTGKTVLQLPKKRDIHHLTALIKKRMTMRKTMITKVQLQVSRKSESKKNFKDTGFYTIVLPSTSSHPTPLKCRYEGYSNYPGSTFCSKITSAVAKYASRCTLVQVKICLRGLTCKIALSGCFVNLRYFSSSCFQGYCSLLVIVLAVQFAISFSPYCQKVIPNCVNGFHHP